MSKVAVVGGAGFIGTQTCIELILNKHDVTVIDLVRSNVPLVKSMIADATDYNQLYRALDNDFDYVYMFAAVSDSSENIRSPLYSINQNIVGLANVLQAVKDLKIGRIIFSSTVWVYSVAEQRHVDEQTDLIITNSDHLYTTSKITCETLIRNYHESYGINYTILRYGIAYGPGCHPDTILSKFMTNALHNKPLIITGNGTISRNFLNVADHARGNVAAMGLAAENQIINLEGPEKITLARVADRVRQLHAGDVNVIYTDQRPGDYEGKIVSNLKSKKLMDWAPTVSFNTGTQEMYNYLKHKHDENTSNSSTC